MLIRFLCFVNYIDFRINLIEFHCLISFCSNWILFEILNTSIWISCTIASCHFSSTLISSNSKKKFHVFRYSINFWAFKFSVVIKTMCCSVRKSCIVCISTLIYLCNFSASLTLFWYSIAFIVEIWFFDFAIMRLLNHASNFVVFAKFFFSCILTLLVIFRDTACVHEVENAFFDAFWSLCDLETINIRLELEFFDLFWTIDVIVVFVHDWIKFIISFNFWFNCEWIFFIFSSIVFSIRISMFCEFTFSRLCVAISLCNFCVFCTLCATFDFAFQRRRFVVVHDLNLNLNLSNFRTDVVVLEFSELMLIDSNLLNLMHNLCILRYFLAHFSNSWLFWLKLLFFDFISMTDLLFVFELFVLNFWLRYLTKNWPIYQLRNRFFLK